MPNDMKRHEIALKRDQLLFKAADLTKSRDEAVVARAQTCLDFLVWFATIIDKMIAADDVLVCYRILALVDQDLKLIVLAKYKIVDGLDKQLNDEFNAVIATYFNVAFSGYEAIKQAKHHDDSLNGVIGTLSSLSNQVIPLIPMLNHDRSKLEESLDSITSAINKAAVGILANVQQSTTESKGLHNMFGEHSTEEKLKQKITDCLEFAWDLEHDHAGTPQLYFRARNYPKVLVWFKPRIDALMLSDNIAIGDHLIKAINNDLAIIHRGLQDEDVERNLDVYFKTAEWVYSQVILAVHGQHSTELVKSLHELGDQIYPLIIKCEDAGKRPLALDSMTAMLRMSALVASASSELEATEPNVFTIICQMIDIIFPLEIKVDSQESALDLIESANALVPGYVKIMPLLACKGSVTKIDWIHDRKNNDNTFLGFTTNVWSNPEDVITIAIRNSLKREAWLVRSRILNMRQAQANIEHFAKDGSTAPSNLVSVASEENAKAYIDERWTTFEPFIECFDKFCKLLKINVDPRFVFEDVKQNAVANLPSPQQIVG